MLREVIQIDSEKCNGCGNCITNCHEGALQMIDKKAVLVSELMCDGLGACIGHCATGAMKIEKQEVQQYSETEVMKKMTVKGRKVVLAHLKHLQQHKEYGFMKEGLNYLSLHKVELFFDVNELKEMLSKEESMKEVREFKSIHSGTVACPGSHSFSFDKPGSIGVQKHDEQVLTESQLTHWPIQMHLIQPGAAHFRNADLLLSADCVAYSCADFHSMYLKGKKLAIACPKLDSNKEVYTEKLVMLIDEARINTITVMIMEVPCCGGLLQLTKLAAAEALRKVPVKAITISTLGKVLSENWI
jgi:NAD-dependent dihydropyrimidine dehydrogenase PreA subunit